MLTTYNYNLSGLLIASFLLTNVFCLFKEMTNYVGEGSLVNTLYHFFQKGLTNLKFNRFGNSIINMTEQSLSAKFKIVIVHADVLNWTLVLNEAPLGFVLDRILFFN